MHAAAPPTKSVAPPSGTAPPVSALPFLALVTANVALAFGPWFVRVADTGPVAAGFWRITLAAPVLALLAIGGGARPRRLTPMLWLALVVGGIAFAGDLGSWHLGILDTTLANATLLGNCATLLFPLYGFLVARRWPTRMQGAALLLALVGAALLVGRSYELDPRHVRGDLFCILAGVLYTVYFVLMARVRRVMAPLSALALSTLASSLPLLLFAGAMGERIVPAHWTPLVGLALVSQVLGQGCMIYALGRLSPLVIGIALLIQPIVAGSVGWIVYGERLAWPDGIGAALVAVALVLVRERPAVAQRDAKAHLERA